MTIESFQRDAKFAAEYLNTILEQGDQQEPMVALRYMAQAFGGVARLAEEAELNATTLYRTLSPQGNPELKGLRALLKGNGDAAGGAALGDVGIALRPTRSLGGRVFEVRSAEPTVQKPDYANWVIDEERHQHPR